MTMACCNVFFLVKLLIYFHIISHNFVLSLPCKLSTEQPCLFICHIFHADGARKFSVADWPRHQTHHFALIVQYLILHACSGIFALDYFHEILVLASALFYYHFLLSVQAKKNTICSLQKKKITIQQHRAHNPTYLPGQVYFLVRVVVIVPIVQPYVLPAIHTGTGKPSRT